MRLSTEDYAALAEFRHRLRGFLAFSEAEARKAGLEPQQHQLLLAVRGFGANAPTVRQISERLMLKHHSTVGLVDRLEERGLIRRRRSTEDRRAVRLFLTKAGAEVLETLSLSHRAHLKEAGPGLIGAVNGVLKKLG